MRSEAWVQPVWAVNTVTRRLWAFLLSTTHVSNMHSCLYSTRKIGYYYRHVNINLLTDCSFISNSRDFISGWGEEMKCYSKHLLALPSTSLNISSTSNNSWSLISCQHDVCTECWTKDRRYSRPITPSWLGGKISKQLHGENINLLKRNNFK